MPKKQKLSPTYQLRRGVSVCRLVDLCRCEMTQMRARREKKQPSFITISIN